MAHITDEDRIRTIHNTSRYFVEHRQIAWAVADRRRHLGRLRIFLDAAAQGSRRFPCASPSPPASGPAHRRRRSSSSSPAPSSRPSRKTKPSIRPPPPITASAPSLCPARRSSTSSCPKTPRTAASSSAISTSSSRAWTAASPPGATPVQFQSDFGDTAALMMTVASPPDRRSRNRDARPVRRRC